MYGAQNRVNAQNAKAKVSLSLEKKKKKIIHRGTHNR